MGLAAGIIGTVLYLFRTLLNVTFSIFSLIPALPATFLAELLVTSIVGVVFWVGFIEARETGAFFIPARLFRSTYRKIRELSAYQVKVIGHALSPTNIRLVGERLWAFLSGDLSIDPPRVRGDAFAAAPMTYLLAGRYDELRGPLGEIFIRSIRDRYEELGDSSVSDIAAYMRGTYDAGQIGGVLSRIKGKMFERLIETHENADGDPWVAELHPDESYPVSDIIFTNLDNGETVEVSLKATDNAAYIEAALTRYPDIPIMTTSEMADQFEDIAMVSASEISNEDLTRITGDNFDEMVENIAPIGTSEAVFAAGAGGAASGAAQLWPFAIANVRNRITRDQLTSAFQRALPETGREIALRIAFAATFGPIYAWYVLARAIMKLWPERQEASTDARLLIQA